jgi:hypothetical protein
MVALVGSSSLWPRPPILPNISERAEPTNPNNVFRNQQATSTLHKEKKETTERQQSQGPPTHKLAQGAQILDC